MTRTEPLVTVVIATLNEERFIEACLASVQAQTYPATSVEIIVADGGSTDRTEDVVLAVAATDSRITLVPNPARLQAAAFNLGVERACGEIVALVSAHSVLSSTYLEECVAELERSGADNVGGRMIAVGEGVIPAAIAAAMRSPVGVGGAKYHYDDEACDVPSAWPGCFRRDVFDRVGRFRADLAVHEDFELNHRIWSAGGRVRFSPRISATYHVRPSLRKLARQYVRYGRAKAGVAREIPGVMRPYHFVPPALVGVLGVSAAASVLLPPARWTLAAVGGVYFAGLVGAAWFAGRDEPAAVKAALPAVLGTMHLCWGTGIWIGLLAGPPRGRPAGDAEQPSAAE